MPATYNFTGRRAATRAANLQRSWTWLDEAGDPVPMSGMSAEMQVRAFPGSDTLILDAGADITLHPTSGLITLDVPAADMEIGSESATVSYVYDLFIIDGATRICVLSGDFEVTPNITEF